MFLAVPRVWEKFEEFKDKRAEDLVLTDWVDLLKK
jgi:hypothetical protein